MNINKIIKPDINKTLSDKICLRAKVDTGTRCNYNCYFCYYKDRLNEDHKDINIIKKEIDKLYKNGIKEFDLSGGESSIHPDFIEIIRYANQYGKVTMLSNGSMFSKKFLNKAYDAGLRGILLSVHGHDEISHNKAVDTKFAWDKIIDCMINIIELKKTKEFEFRINCTVDEKFEPIKYSELLNKYRPDQINFLPLNYWEEAKNLVPQSYKIMGKKIEECIDFINFYIEVNIRYIPLCFIKDYRVFVKGIYQHIFDLKDWNIVTYNSNKKVNKQNMFEQAFNNRINSYYKPRSCTHCKYVLVCDGIEHVAKDQKLVPIIGTKCENINGYC